MPPEFSADAATVRGHCCHCTSLGRAREEGGGGERKSEGGRGDKSDPSGAVSNKREAKAEITVCYAPVFVFVRPAGEVTGVKWKF